MPACQPRKICKSFYLYIMHGDIVLAVGGFSCAKSP